MLAVMEVSKGSWAGRLLWSGMVSRRGMARLIDDLLVVGVQYCSLLMGVVVYALAAVAGGDPPMDVVIVAWALGLSGFITCVGYEIVATRVGVSIGKLICGLRIVDAGSTTRLPLGRSVGRWFAVSGVQPLAWLALGLGEGTAPRDAVILASVVAAALAWRIGLALSIITTPGAEGGLHDRIVRSCVVRHRQST